MVYRDQITIDWETFCQQPIKHVIDIIPKLRKCDKQGCMCPHWHPGPNDADGPILDLWQRDHVSMHFQRLRPADASIFVCCIRMLVEVFQVIFPLSGTNGVYFEPRSADGKGQDNRFQTIKQSLTDAKATQALIGESSCLVRVNMRYGVKVEDGVASKVHQKVKPNEPYFAGGTKTAFKIGPMPWGTTKRSVQILFDQWNWAAKPVQPVGKAADGSGLMWQVFAKTEPPSTVYTLEHGDVVILKDQNTQKKQWTPPQAQMSQSTINQHRATQDAAFDPWAAAASKLPRRMNDAATAQMAPLGASIDQRIQSKVQAAMSSSTAGDEPMNPVSDPRIQKLEQQMAQMQASYEQLHSAQSNLQQHSTKVEQKVDQLHAQVETQTKAFSQALDTKLMEQMGRIESLIGKYRKTDHE